MAVIRRSYIFHGDVQGVGFRYYACQEARALGITGWVQNCYDGTVHMEAQGEERALYELISYMDQIRHIEITDLEYKALPVKPHELGFKVMGY